MPASSLEGSEDRIIKVPVRDRTLEFKGLEYLVRWVIPNALFHVTTAYAILRQAGVEIGKNDYLVGSGSDLVKAPDRNFCRRPRGASLRTGLAAAASPVASHAAHEETHFTAPPGVCWHAKRH